MKNPTGNILNKERLASHCDVGGQKGVNKHRRCSEGNGHECACVRGLVF